VTASLDSTAPDPRSPRVSARERLLTAADELFYGNGINTTGVDEISTRAGVTKATLYNNFSGKEELIAAYLDRRLLRWMLEARRTDVPSSSAEERVGRFFDMLQSSVEADDFRGCPFTNAVVEKPRSGPIGAVVRQYRRDLVAHVTGMLTGPGAAERADLIVMLYDGALVSAKSTGETGIVGRARRHAVTLATP